MPDNSPITTSIRKIIFENFNDDDLRFNNDQIFEILRNIAQNFTTQWFKLFEPIEKVQCSLCKKESYIISSESKICQNSSCGSTL